jgi:plastocyanin
MNRFATVLVVFLTFFLVAQLEAHEVLGQVQIVLKGDKKKTDLSSVILYLEPVVHTAIPPEVLKKNFSMSTKNKQFTPRALAVPVGAGVRFPNYDSIFHNIFSVSSPNQFDLGLYKGGTSKTQSFQHPGVVKVFCNVHPQMSATIVVTASPHYTVADQAGAFNFGLIPNGTFQLRAYADEGQTAQKVVVGEKPLQVNVTIDGRNFKKVRHKNKFGKDYSSEGNERY